MRHHLPTIIIFGSGKISELSRVAKEKLRASRPFLVTDRGIQKAGIVEKIKTQLPGIRCASSSSISKMLTGISWGIENHEKA
jgi:alcohol dehydrogenase class IV